METHSDVNPINLNTTNSSTPPKSEDFPDLAIHEKPKIKFNPDDDYYDMSGEKHLVIFGHDQYDKMSPAYYREPPTERGGTKKDVDILESTFKEIGFNVQIYPNKTWKVIWDTLCEIRQTDYSSASCFCVVILTHGAKNGELCAYDRTYSLNDVTKLFESHPSLVGKPKLFFIQACRGKSRDDGNRIETDGERKTEYVVPSHADFLIMKSTVEEEDDLDCERELASAVESKSPSVTSISPKRSMNVTDESASVEAGEITNNYLSYRDCRGSWLIQELCTAICNYHKDLDILHIITRVQKAVALEYATYTPRKKSTNDKRQMPETTFTLTKILKF